MINKVKAMSMQTVTVRVQVLGPVPYGTSTALVIVVFPYCGTKYVVVILVDYGTTGTRSQGTGYQ